MYFSHRKPPIFSRKVYIIYILLPFFFFLFCLKSLPLHSTLYSPSRSRTALLCIMPFFDKDKVKLELNANTVTCIGGGVQGILSMTVIEDFKCRAVRVKILGVEETTKKVRHNKRSRTLTDSVTHFSQVFNLMDASNALNNNGDASSTEDMMLRTGNYTFNIQVTFPVNLPPSFYRTLNDGKTSMRYYALAYVDIPRGFDAEVEFPFLVLSTIPRTVYDKGRTVPYRTAVVRSPIDKGVCGCCSSENPGYIETSAELLQTVLVLPTNPIPSSKDMPPMPPPLPPGETPYIPNPPPQLFPRTSSELSMRIFISNRSKKETIDSVLVELVQGVEKITQGRRSYITACIGSVTIRPPCGNLFPGQDTFVDALLSVSQPLASSSLSAAALGVPLPSLSTPLTTTNTFLRITYPHVEVDEPFSLCNVIVLSSVVDVFNRLPERCEYMPGR